MIKTVWIADGVDKITTPEETGVRIIKAVGVPELRTLCEVKSKIKKGIFHVCLDGDINTLSLARPLLDELSAELDLHSVILNISLSPQTRYDYLESIIREGHFTKVELSHSLASPDPENLARFIIKVRDDILLNWTEYAYGAVADKIAEQERFAFDSEKRRVQNLKGNEYRTYLVKWFESVKRDLRTIKERLNRLEEVG